jgi:hypothetical protein
VLTLGGFAPLQFRHYRPTSSLLCRPAMFCIEICRCVARRMTSLGTDALKTTPQSASPTATLTRYEMALETAKALVSVRARQEANPQWANSAPKPALKALHQMTQAFTT